MAAFNELNLTTYIPNKSFETSSECQQIKKINDSINWTGKVHDWVIGNILDPKHTSYFLVQDRTVVGYAITHNQSDQANPSILLIALGVLKESGKQGFGTRLVRHVMEVANKHQKPLPITLYCTKHNLTYYQRFSKNMTYKVVGKYEWGGDRHFVTIPTTPSSSTPASSTATKKASETKVIRRKDYVQSEELKQIHGVLYQLMNVTHQLLNKYEIRYWAAAGTMLGVARHGAIMDWDDDIDIQIHPDDNHKLFDPKFRKEAEEIGLHVLDFFDSTKSGENQWCVVTIAQSLKGPLAKIAHTVEKNNGNRRNPGKFRTEVHPNIDLFLSSRRGNQVTYKGPWAYGLWPKEWVDVSEISNLREIPFGPIKISVPAEKACKDYLVRAYGDNWNDVGYTPAFNHQTRENTNEVVKILFEEGDHHGGEYILDNTLPTLEHSIPKTSVSLLNVAPINITKDNIAEVIHTELILPYYAQPLPKFSDVTVPLMDIDTLEVQDKQWSKLSKEQKLRVNNFNALPHNRLKETDSDDRINNHFFSNNCNNVPYLSGDPREHHGNDHSVRVSIFTQVFAYLYNKYLPASSISPTEIILAQTLAAGYNSGRQTQGTNVYLAKSAENTLNVLKHHGLLCEQSLDACKEAIVNIDSNPLNPYKVKSIIAKCVQNALSSDFSRLQWTDDKPTPGEQSDAQFNQARVYLDIFKEFSHEMKKNNADAAFVDLFKQELDTLRREMNKLIKMTHNKEFRESAVNHSKGYYVAILEKIDEANFPQIHKILSMV